MEVANGRTLTLSKLRGHVHLTGNQESPNATDSPHALQRLTHLWEALHSSITLSEQGYPSAVARLGNNVFRADLSECCAAPAHGTPSDRQHTPCLQTLMAHSEELLQG